MPTWADVEDRTNITDTTLVSTHDRGSWEFNERVGEGGDGGDGGGATTFADQFNRADSLPIGSGYGGVGLGPDWVGDAWQIQGNRACRIIDGGAQPDQCVFLHDLGTPDHWIESSVIFPAAGNGAYLILNARRTVDNSATAYMGFWNVGTGHWVLGKYSGSYADLTLGPTTPNPMGLTKLLRLEVEGQAVRLFVDGVLTVSGTDTAIASGNYVGFQANSDQGQLGYFDSVRCGPLPYTAG